MKEGDVLLASFPQRDGTVKDRPALFLLRMPPFQGFLVCGMSTQLQQAMPGFDEINGHAEVFRASPEG